MKSRNVIIDVFRDKSRLPLSNDDLTDIFYNQGLQLELSIASDVHVSTSVIIGAGRSLAPLSDRRWLDLGVVERGPWLGLNPAPELAPPGDIKPRVNKIPELTGTGPLELARGLRKAWSKNQ